MARLLRLGRSLIREGHGSPYEGVGKRYLEEEDGAQYRYLVLVLVKLVKV